MLQPHVQPITPRYRFVVCDTNDRLLWLIKVLVTPIVGTMALPCLLPFPTFFCPVLAGTFPVPLAYKRCELRDCDWILGDPKSIECDVRPFVALVPAADAIGTGLYVAPIAIGFTKSGVAAG